MFIHFEATDALIPIILLTCGSIVGFRILCLLLKKNEKEKEKIISV